MKTRKRFRWIDIGSYFCLIVLHHKKCRAKGRVIIYECTHIYNFRRDKLLYYKLEIVTPTKTINLLQYLIPFVRKGLALIPLKMKYCTTSILVLKNVMLGSFTLQYGHLFFWRMCDDARPSSMSRTSVKFEMQRLKCI